MARTFISPSKYIQGPGEMNNLGKYASGYGRKALVLISAGGLRRSGADIEKSFEGIDTQLFFETFNGECSRGEIDRLVEIDAQQHNDGGHCDGQPHQREDDRAPCGTFLYVSPIQVEVGRIVGVVQQIHWLAHLIFIPRDDTGAL